MRLISEKQWWLTIEKGGTCFTGTGAATASGDYRDQRDEVQRRRAAIERGPVVLERYTWNDDELRSMG